MLNDIFTYCCQFNRTGRVALSLLALGLLPSLVSHRWCSLADAQEVEQSADSTSNEDLNADARDESNAPAEQTTAGTAETVRKLLRQLEAAEAQQRDSAEKELVELGASILPLLPPITPRTGGELKGRLQRIRQSLQIADVETFFKESTVTLHGSLELGEAIKQIQSQTGNPVELQSEEGLASTTVELDVENEPFWTVLNKIMQQTNLRINAFGTTEGNLVLSPGGVASLQSYQTGPFRVEPMSVTVSRNFTSQLGGQLDLSFQFAWEPRLKPVFMQIPTATVSASTNDGQTLAATNAQAVLEIPLNLGGCATQVDLQLARPDRSALKIDSLKGELVVAVPGELHQYIFEKFGNGARQSEKFGDVTVTLEGARRNGAVYEMRVLASFGDSQGALESFRGWILSNQAYLLDAKGQRMENVGLQTYAITPNAVGIAYLFQINSDPDSYKLVYESPAAISKQTVSYELKDIELP